MSWIIDVLVYLIMFLNSQENFDPAVIPKSASYNLLPTESTNQVIHHAYYDLSYSEKHEQADWVAYWLTAEMIKGIAIRKNDFREDPQVVTGSATLKDYKGSGYDRGHLAPSADFKFNSEAMSESFYMSNMSPQDPSFNRGAWKKLEEQIREWAVQKDSIFIVTAGILNDTLKTIGENQVAVPDYFYKIVLDLSEEKAVAFMLPNRKLNDPFKNFIVSIDSIEIISGIDFFQAMPDEIENLIESEVSINFK